MLFSWLHLLSAFLLCGRGDADLGGGSCNFDIYVLASIGCFGVPIGKAEVVVFSMNADLVKVCRLEDGEAMGVRDDSTRAIKSLATRFLLVCFENFKHREQTE